MSKIYPKDQWLGDPLGLLNQPHPIPETKLWSSAATFTDLYCHDQKTRGYSPQEAAFPFLRRNRVVIIPLTWPDVRQHIIYTIVNYYTRLGIFVPKDGIQ